MQRLLLLVFLLGVVTPVAAQTTGPRCAETPSGRVNVETTTQGTVTGTLFCLSATEVSLLREGQQIAIPLTEVRRIQKPADPVWDGALKGASVVVMMWAVACGFCGDAAEGMLRAGAGWAAVGGIIDALQTNRTTIYAAGRARQTAGPRPALAWRIRF